MKTSIFQYAFLILIFFLIVESLNAQTCNDPNAHNLGEEGACQTCFDFIQNGDETGLDCGGSNPNCPVCPPPVHLDIEGNINISNAGNFLSVRTSGELQNILTLDGNDDIVINRGSIVDGYPSHVLIGLGANKRFLVRNSSNTNSIFIIDEATGNVGIGTTVPDAKLHVVSTIPEDPLFGEAAIVGEVNGLGFAGIGVEGISHVSAGKGVQGEGNYGVYGYGRTHPNAPWATGVFGHSGEGETGVRGFSPGFTGVIGSSNGSAGRGVVGNASISSGCDFDAIGAGTNYCSTSSRRWKKNIKTLSSPLEKLSILRGVSFNWDEEHGGHADIGFIAEEVGKVLPSIVVYESNGIDASSMDYSMMTPLLVEAANAMRQEYQDKFDNQQSQIDALTQEMVELRLLLKASVVQNINEE